MRHTLSILAAVATLTAAAAPAAAQRAPQPFSSGPSAWTTLSIGYQQLGDIYEGGSNSAWAVGSAPVFQGSLEMGIRNGGSLGAIVGYGSIPMTYYGSDCNQCDADVKMWQALGSFRIGGGRGLHQVIQVNGGVTSWQDIRARGTGTKLGPGSPVIAPTVSIGYGFGYTMSPNMQFILLQEYGLMFFKKGDLAAGDNQNHPRTQATRIGLRLGLGGSR